MEKPDISIIIPVYNAEKYLARCLDSIAATHIERMEVILVDDGSTDAGPQICQQYCEQYPFFSIVRQDNLGPAAARNKGMELATGEYIAFLDADDYIEPSVFARHFQLIRQYGADIWVSDFVRVADNGCVLDEVFQIDDTEEPICSAEYLESFLAAKDCVWNVWRYVFRRDYLERERLRFSEGFNIAEDLEFVVKAIISAKSFAFFHKPYYSYRVNYGASLTRQHSAEKLRQFVHMLQSAKLSLGADNIARLISAKLAREYILNISSFYEVPKQERNVALRELKRGKKLMDGARGIYIPMSMLIKLAGIRLSAAMLLSAKRAKRFVRGVKTKRFG